MRTAKWTTTACAALALLLLGGEARPKIPVPDHILHGTVMSGGEVVTQGTVSVRLAGSGEPLASYALGS